MSQAAGHDGVRPQPLLHIALVYPEIPNNTGSIGRLCVGLGLRLHLVHPLGFSLDEHAVRRSGLDYWPRIDLREHEDLPAYAAARDDANWWVLSARAERSIYDVPFQRGDHVVFGRESTGLPPEVVEAAGDRAVRIPLVEGERSLNLSNAASVVAYQALQRLIKAGEARLGPGCTVEPVSDAACEPAIRDPRISHDGPDTPGTPRGPCGIE